MTESSRRGVTRGYVGGLILATVMVVLALVVAVWGLIALFSDREPVQTPGVVSAAGPVIIAVALGMLAWGLWLQAVQLLRGLRTPRLAPCAAAVVAEAGYVYDASPHPTWLGHGWRGLRTTRRPWLEAGVVCVPLSTTPGLRLPVGWYVLRAFGVSLSALLARWAGVGTPWVHLYFHPWEASDLRPWLGAHPLARGTGPGWVTSLRRLLERVAPQLLPSTVGAAVEAWRADPLRGA